MSATAYAVDVISDHDPTTVADALAWLNKGSEDDPHAEPTGNDGEVRSWWIVEGCTDRAQAISEACSHVREAPGCTYAEWWDAQPAEVRP